MSTKASDAVIAAPPPPMGSVPDAGDAAAAENLDEWARLLACDEIAWPDDLATQLESELLHKVQRHRRRQLVEYIARLVARDLFNQLEPGE